MNDEDDGEPVPAKSFIERAAKVSRLSNKDWMRIQLTLRDHVEDNYPPSVGRVFREIVRRTNRNRKRPDRAPQHLHRGTAWPPIMVLVNRLKLERSTVKKAIRTLRRARIIFVHYRSRKGWGNLASQYVVNVSYLENYSPSAGGEKSPRVGDKQPPATVNDDPPNIYEDDNLDQYSNTKGNLDEGHGLATGPTENAPSALTLDEAVQHAWDVDETTPKDLVCRMLRAGGNGCIRERLLTPDQIDPVYELMREGCEFHADIWLALRERCTMGRGDGTLPDIRSWKYLRSISHEFLRKRRQDQQTSETF